MSDLTLAEVKAYLDVIHTADDSKLQLLLDAAEDEALQYMDRDNLTDWGVCPDEVTSESEPTSEIDMPGSVRLGILILVQAAYQASPADAEQLRLVAEKKLFPYRCRLGV